MAGDLIFWSCGACIVHHHPERSSQCTRVVDCGVVFHCRLAVSPRILCGTINPRFDCRYASRHASVTNCGHLVWSTTRYKQLMFQAQPRNVNSAAEEDYPLIALQMRRRVAAYLWRSTLRSADTCRRFAQTHAASPTVRLVPEPGKQLTCGIV
jgi:hypothetical protein